jgi:hypothetical protein
LTDMDVLLLLLLYERAGEGKDTFSNKPEAV